MPDTPSLTLVKRFTYRGLPEEWSNTYHFSGATPADDAAWKALMLAFHAVEKPCYTSGHVLVHGYGYAAGVEHSVAQVDFTQGSPLMPPGTTFPGSIGDSVPGDSAAWIRAKIGTSATGKAVYIRKYFHGVLGPLGGGDQIPTAFQTILQTAANSFVAGTGLDGRKWCGPQAQVATLPGVSRYITTRTLKRRGKRPT